MPYAIKVQLKKVAEKHGQDAARRSQKKLQEQLGHPITNCHTHHPPPLGPINLNTVTAARKKAARHAALYVGDTRWT